MIFLHRSEVISFFFNLFTFFLSDGILSYMNLSVSYFVLFGILKTFA